MILSKLKSNYTFIDQGEHCKIEGNVNFENNYIKITAQVYDLKSSLCGNLSCSYRKGENYEVYLNIYDIQYLQMITTLINNIIELLLNRFK